MAYLVTGGTGFIGSYVVRDLLNVGKEVVCFQRSGITPTFQEVIGEDRVGKVKVIQGDVSNTLQLFEVIRKYGIDRIVHVGYLLRPASEEQPSYALQVNCVGMNNLLEAARLFGLKRLVWVSSTRAFGRIAQFYKKPMGDDDAIFMPDNFYGATKVLNEFMAGHYFRHFGTDSIGCRIGLVFGYGKRTAAGGLLTQLLRDAALNKPVTIGYLDFVQGYVDVEDVSSAVVKACDAPTGKTRVFNIQEGEYSNRQFAETIRQVNPKAKVTLIEGAGGMLRFDQPELARADTTGARTELGWQPKFGLSEMIRKVMNRWRKEEDLAPL